MIRYFLVLAVTGGSLLVADMVLGFVAASEAPGPHAVGAGRPPAVLAPDGRGAPGHPLDRLHLLHGDRQVGQGSGAGLSAPRLVSSRRRSRNKRRAFRFVMGSMTTIAVAAWLGGAADTLGSAYALWHLGAAALAVAFNLGSFVVEYAAIVGHARLLMELKDQADRLREERYGSSAVAVVSDGSEVTESVDRDRSVAGLSSLPTDHCHCLLRGVAR